MGKVVWKGWATSWDQIAVPVTIAINPNPKLEINFIADVEKKFKKIKTPANNKIKA